MEAFGTEGNSSTLSQWQDLAGRVAALIRDLGIDIFRQAVRDWAFKQVESEDRRGQHKDEHLAALKKDGVIYIDGSIPDKPEGDYFFHLETLRGSIKLPPELELPSEPPERPELPACLLGQVPSESESWSETDKNEVEVFRDAMAKFFEQEQEFWAQRAKAIFEHVKQHGFPAHKGDGFPYEFDVCVWLPAALYYDEDPSPKNLLPIPRSELTDAEWLTILAAVHDAHWRGTEKVAPWGVSEGGQGPDPWPSVAKREDRSAALSYFMLFRQAENADSGDLPVISRRLDDFRTDVPAGPRESKNVFKREGNTWTIRFNGGETHRGLKDVKAVRDIHFLLSQECKVGIEDLPGNVGFEEITKSVTVATKDDFKDLLKQISQKRHELVSENDSLIKEETEQEIKALEKQLNQNFDKLGNPRQLSGDWNKVIEGTQTRINRWYKDNKDELSHLIQHLKDRLSISAKCAYTRDGSISWDLGKK